MFNSVENNKACMNKHSFISFFNTYLRYIDMVYEYKTLDTKRLLTNWYLQNWNFIIYHIICINLPAWPYKYKYIGISKITNIIVGLIISCDILNIPEEYLTMLYYIIAFILFCR